MDDHFFDTSCKWMIMSLKARTYAKKKKAKGKDKRKKKQKQKDFNLSLVLYFALTGILFLCPGQNIVKWRDSKRLKV